jgi:putative RNA 2'-phosphotransferase
VSDDAVRHSRFLSYVLRHHPEEIGIELDAAGWVDVGALLRALEANGRRLGEDQLRRLVEVGTDKRRLELRGNRIRAAQGHSVPVELGLEPLRPPDELFHGTARRFLDRIRREGLRPMERNHVHLSADRETAEAVGARHGAVVVLTVDAARRYAGGTAFYRAANGVWLTGALPPEYLRES